MEQPDPALQHLCHALRRFTQERDWAQFHTPKNLASALVVEAAELLEPFQWLQTGQKAELSSAQMQNIRHEMADVLNYLVMLADQLEIDLIAAAQEKILLNAAKYPAELACGQADKYTAYLSSQTSSKTLTST